MKSSAYFEKIKLRLSQSKCHKYPLGVFQYNIKSDDETLIVFLDLKNLLFGETTKEKIDAVINVTDEDFVLMITKKLSGKDALEEGKITISGNVELAEKLFNKNC